MTRATFWTDERLTLYPRAVLAALVAAGLLVSLGDASGPTGGGLGGDYAAFHAAGSIVASGDTAQLYDWQRQAAAQTGLHPDDPTGFLAFAYPPFVAAAYAPLSLLPFPLAWALHTSFMAACLAAAAIALRPRLGSLGVWTAALVALAVTWYPMFRSLLGGQNTPLTLVLFAFTWRLWVDGRRDAAGVCAALLLYKPQFGIPLLGLLALADRRVLRGALPTAAGLWLVGVGLAGPGWVGWWWSQIARFHLLDQSVNAANSVGLLGTAEAIFGPGTPLAFGVGGLLTAACVAWLMALWARTTDADQRFATTAAALVLVPPHSMFYDAGLGALSLWWCAAQGWGSVVALGWGAGLTGLLATALGTQPLAAVLAGLAAVTARGAPRSRETEGPRAP